MQRVHTVVIGPTGDTMITYIEYKSSMAYRGTPARKHKAAGKPRLFKGWRA